MKGMASVALGVVLGLAVGAAGRLSTRSSVSERGDPEGLVQAPQENSQARQAHAGGPSVSRPSLEEALAAKGFQQQLLIARYLREATIDEVLELLERSYDPKERQSIWPVISTIYQRGLALDAEAVVAMVEEKDERGYNLADVFRHWVKIDLEAAIVASEGRSKRIREAVLVHLSETDPDRALAMLEAEGLGSPHMRARIAGNQIKELLETDLQTALDHALGLKARGERDSALSTVLSHWAERDPGAALEWIRSAGADEISNPKDLLANILPKIAEAQPGKVQAYLEELPMTSMRGALEGHVLKRLASKDFDAAAQRVRAYPKGAYRDYLFNQLVDRANPPENLLSLISELEVDLQNPNRLTVLEIASERWGSSSGGGSDNLRQAVETLLSKMVLESPERAMQTAFTTLGGGQNYQFQELAESLIQQWTSADAKAAAEWTLTLPGSQFASSLQKTSVGSWASSDPAEAASTLQERGALTEASVRSELAKAWSRQDSTGLLDWADSLPAESRDLLLPEAIKRVAEHLPEEAAERLDATASVPEQQSLVEAVGRQWGSRAPQEALAWMQEQPEDLAIGSTVKATSKAWVLAEPAEASAWIGELEPGSRRDHAVAGLVHALVSSNNPRRDFDSAGIWVETIADPELKLEWVGEIQTRQAKESPAPPANAGGGSLRIESIEAHIVP